MEFITHHSSRRTRTSMGYRNTTVSIVVNIWTTYLHLTSRRFLVEEHSDLYYDPSPLREYLKEGQADSDESGTSSSSKPPVPTPDFSNHAVPGTPQLRRNPSMPPPAQPHMPFSPRHPGAGGFPSQMQFANMGSPVPPGQFYGNDPSMSSPMRMGGMGMPMDGMGGMGGMGMGSPNVARRMGTRGMGMDDGFGGMH